MKPHIQLLLNLETVRKDGFWWGRTDKSTIWISTVGYNMQSHMDAESALIKLGCRPNFKVKGLRGFDPVCGRYFTQFTEPKKRGAR